MPDKRTHRGPGPEDPGLFAADKLPNLRLAAGDYSELLTKGYAAKSSLKLVGDHFSLTQRQRLALMRGACTAAQLKNRTDRCIEPEQLTHQPILIDGYNLLITIEAALGSAPVLLCMDGCCRDLAGLHGSYRKVAETIPAIELIARSLAELKIAHARWLFDSPVSNSGRLKTLLAQLAETNSWPWQIDLLTNPDTELIAAESIITTSDSDVLDKCKKWINLTQWIITNHIPQAWIINLTGPS